MKSKLRFSDHVLQESLFVAIIVFSAMSTFAFYATYVEAIIPTFLVADETIRNLLTGGLGVLMLEGAAVMWQRILHFDALRTPRQLELANMASRAALYMSIVISLVYLILSTDLIDDVRIVNIAAVGGLLTIVAATGLQLWFVYNYNHHSIEASDRRARADAAALAIEEYHKLQLAHARSSARAVAERAWGQNQPITTSDLLQQMVIGLDTSTSRYEQETSSQKTAAETPPVTGVSQKQERRNGHASTVPN